VNFLYVPAIINIHNLLEYLMRERERWEAHEWSLMNVIMSYLHAVNSSNYCWLSALQAWKSSTLLYRTQTLPKVKKKKEKGILVMATHHVAVERKTMDFLPLDHSFGPTVWKWGCRSFDGLHFFPLDVPATIYKTKMNMNNFINYIFIL
jgi:hypothetical protein